MEVKMQRISWLDSCKMPARIHLTSDDGQTTVCGHTPRSKKNWQITSAVPRNIRGSRYCKICFKNGGKILPWLEN